MAERLLVIDQNDDRLFERISTDSTVYILLGGERVPVHVKLKNWSSAGACVTLDRGCLLPEEFRIYKPTSDGEGIRVNCMLVWQVGNEAGFKFSMKKKPAGGGPSQAA